jgi:hypothetical protein
MTHLEIYQTIECAIPLDLRERFGHLSYADMAEVPELAPWAEQLRQAEREWNASADNCEVAA